MTENAPSLMAKLAGVLSTSNDSFKFETEPAIKIEPDGARPMVPHSEANLRKLPAGQVSELILRELQELPDFHAHAVSLTVYGLRPWNAMLNFSAKSSVSPAKAAAMRETLVEIVYKLRKQVEVDADQS